jgi:hypothetical protein
LILAATVSSRAWSQAVSGAEASHEVILIIAEVAVMSLLDARPLVLHLGVGAMPQREATGSNRIFYTAVNAPGRTRSIAVQWSATDAAPAGVTLHVRAAQVPAGFGIATGDVAISGSPQTLIRGIPSCATGTGDGGVELQYRAVLDDPSRAFGGERRTVMITFTITDDT